MTAEPSILTANVYFWKPGSSASQRRSSESRRLSEVASWLESLGFEVVQASDRVTGVKGDVEAVFQYNESCKNVYKHLSVTRGGKRSTIATLRKMAQVAA